MSKRSAAVAKKAATKAVNPSSSATAEATPRQETATAGGGLVRPSTGGSKLQNNSTSNGKSPSTTTKRNGGVGSADMKEREIRLKAYIEDLNSPAYGEEGFSLWYSANPYRRDIEKAWVEYSLVWIPIVCYLFTSGITGGDVGAGKEALGSKKGFGDKEYFGLGCLLMIGTYLWPFIRCKYLHFPTLNAMFYGVAVYGFLLHYYISPFWTDVMHQRLGFNSQLVISEERPYPLWLFLASVPYQAALSTGSIMLLRRIGHICNYGPYWKSRDTNEFYRLAALVIRCYIYVIYPFVIAFLEVIITANPYTAKLLCHESQYWGVVSGTVASGVGYMIAMPIWLWAVSEEEYRPELQDLMRPKSNFELFLSTESRFFHSTIGNALAIGAFYFALEMYIKPEMKAGGLTTIFRDLIPTLNPQHGCLQNPNDFGKDWWNMVAALSRGMLVSGPPQQEEVVGMGEKM